MTAKRILAAAIGLGLLAGCGKPAAPAAPTTPAATETTAAAVEPAMATPAAATEPPATPDPPGPPPEAPVAAPPSGEAAVKPRKGDLGKLFGILTKPAADTVKGITNAAAGATGAGQ